MRPSTGYPRSGLNPSRVAICVEIAQLDATKTPSAAATAAGFTNRCPTIVADIGCTCEVSIVRRTCPARASAPDTVTGRPMLFTDYLTNDGWASRRNAWLDTRTQ